MASFQFPVRTLKGTHFTTELVQNAAENEDVVLDGALAGVNGNARNIVQTITVISDQNLAWEIALYGKDTFAGGTDLDANTILCHHAFAAADGAQVGGAGSYVYFVDGLNLPYQDEDHSGELHIQLINRSATSKNAAGTGEVVVQLWLSPPVFGWAGT